MTGENEVLSFKMYNNWHLFMKICYNLNKMNSDFKEKKTTQAAAQFLTRFGGRENYMKLLKLIYLVDREALLRWGRPVTFDYYVSMNNGPVLSMTYDLISNGKNPASESFWLKHISPPQNYEVLLTRDPGYEELSRAELSLIEEIYAKYGNKTVWQLVDIVHELPEWEDPQGSAIPIQIRDILKAGNKTEIEIAAIEKELSIERLSDSFFK